MTLDRKMPVNVTHEYEEQFEDVPIMLIVMMRVTALLILVLNGTVLYCLCVKKQSMPKIYILQMVCLCLTDNMAGGALLAMSFADYDWFRNDIIRCCFLLGFFISSQSTTLYNVTAICINRFIIMLRMDKLDHHLTKAKVIGFSTAAIMFGFVFCSLPFIFWKPRQEYLHNTGCSMETVFREKLISSMKVFLGTFLFPLLITNLLYGCLFFMLRHKQRQIRPEIHCMTDKSGSSAVNPNTRRIIQENTDSGRGSSIDRNFGPTAIQTTSSGVRQGTSTSTGILNQTTWQKRMGQENVIPAASSTRALSVKQSTLNNVPSTLSSNSERRAHQSRAFALLGFILLFLNIFSWPGITVLLMESLIDSWSLSRGVKFPLFSTITFNSIINPILYTVRVKEFRKALSDTLFCSQSRFRFR